MLSFIAQMAYMFEHIFVQCTVVTQGAGRTWKGCEASAINRADRKAMKSGELADLLDEQPIALGRCIG
jgi:hypothetical protein